MKGKRKLRAALLFSLSGCGGSAPDAEPEPSGESAAGEETVAEENGGEVTDTELSVTGGTVSGTLNDAGTVKIYKGIPYAAPPVGGTPLAGSATCGKLGRRQGMR